MGGRSKARLEAYNFFWLFEFAVCIEFEVNLEHPCDGKTFCCNIKIR